MLPDPVVRQLAKSIGELIGGPLWGNVAAAAASIAITEAEFVNLYSRLENGTARRSDMLAAVTAFEASLLGAGITLTSAGVIAGIGASIPLAVIAVAAAGAAVWYHRNDIAIAEALSVMVDSVAAGDQPWTFLPKMWAEYSERSFHRAVSSSIGTTPDPLVKTIHYIDPLILDLDSDGLEITPLSQSVLFDADGDTVKTATAWASADDGMLVWDRNCNGNIDSGQELFGDETILSSGQKAANGFAALSDLDNGSVVNGVLTGAGDGIFDAKDSYYGTLQVWRDLNQDGVSQANELKTLVETGIASIKLDSTATNINYGDAILTHSSTFTRADGSTGQAGSFILAQNSFVRQFTPISVSAAAQVLPDLAGTGWVRDLREAATLNPELIGLINQARDATTRQDYKAAVGELLREWSNSSDYSSASRSALNDGYGLTLSDPLDAQEAGWMDMAIKASEVERLAFRATLSAPEIAKFDAMRERMIGGLEKIHAYEAFTGFTFLNWSQVLGDAIDYGPRSVPAGRVPIEVWVPLSQILYENRNGFMSSQAGYVKVNIPAPLSGQPHVDMLWNRLLDDASENLMPSLRLSKYLDMVDLSFGESSITYDFGRLDAALASVLTTNGHEGAALLLDLYRNHGVALTGMGWSGADQVRSLMLRAMSDTAVHRAFDVTGVGFFPAAAVMGTEGIDTFLGDASANSFISGAGGDLIFGEAGNDHLLGAAGNDLIDGGSGNDTLEGGDGSDTVQGGAGDDQLNGGNGDDSLLGDAGNDTLYGDAGDDTIVGGVGNDQLLGGAGNDKYLFSEGEGQDTIFSDYDTATGKVNVLLFETGVLPSEVVVTRSGSDLELSMAGSTDKVTARMYFYGDDPANAYNPIQQVQFADGTSWDVASIRSMAIAGNDSAQTLTGYTGADTIDALGGNDSVFGRDGDDTLDGEDGADHVYGDDGNDTALGGAGFDYLYGGNGDDTLSGGAGDDSVFGEAGNDTLDGGAGSDFLSGGLGNNTYLFGRGDGSDTIYSTNDLTAGKLNTLQFKLGVAPTDLLLGSASSASGSLTVQIAGTTDAITVREFLYQDDCANPLNPVQQFKFADGTIWAIPDILAKLFAGSAGDDRIDGTVAADAITGGAGNDTLNGKAGDDSLSGGDGNDSLSGNDGDDSLSGGAGNDSLSGDAGNDTYLFGRGDGQDTIAPNYDDPVATKLNILQFKTGVLPSEVVVTRSSSDLVLTIAGTTDKVTARMFFYGDDPAGTYNPIQQVRFNDGTTWSQDQLLAKASGGTDGADTLTGTPAGDIIYALGGNDTVYGQAGADTLDGGAGADYLAGGDGDDNVRGGADADTLCGGTGNDTLDGGMGNDLLSGDAGNDTYLFGRGGGQDTITPNYDDPLASKLNVLQFKAGVLPSEVVVTRSTSDLVLTIAGTNDTVTARMFFYGDDPAGTYNPIQQVKFDDGTIWDIATIKAKAITGNDTAQTLTGYTGDDTISALGGNDTVYGQAGNDTLDGGAGADSVYGGGGDDSVGGGADADTLSGGAGNDTLDGGAGNDSLSGDAGNDTCLFGRGDGQDTITPNYDDPLATKLNVLQFKAGVLPSEVVVTRSTSDLVLTIAGTNDTVTARMFFYGDDPAGTYNPIQQVKFDDGTTWDFATIKAKAVTGNDTAQTLTGYTGDDTINALGGNDTLYGQAGNDTLDGGAGADSVYGGNGDDIVRGGADSDTAYGGAGNDTLDGGMGNDTLSGDAGNDTYLFGWGDGQDTITPNYDDPLANKLNVLQFKAGVPPSDVVVSRSGSELVLAIAGTSDTITARMFFYGDDPAGTYNPIQQVKFDDGTTWDIATIKAKAITGNDTAQTLTGYTGADTINALGGNDTVYGQAGNDTLDGGAGADSVYGGSGDDNVGGGAENDYVYGNAGNDTLDGGTGNDHLSGEAGNDTYLFGSGSGADTVYDYDATAGNTDLLSIGSGVATDRIWFRRVGSDLEVSIIGSTDKTTISSWYSGGAYHVEQFKTSDGKTLLDSQVDSLVSAMAAFAPPAAGQTNLPADYQTALNPIIAANWR